jgi:hypothetical protein
MINERRRQLFSLIITEGIFITLGIWSLVTPTIFAQDNKDYTVPKRRVEKLKENITQIEQTLAKEEKQPPQINKQAIIEESKEKLRWLKKISDQVEKATKNAESAKNKAEAQVWLKDALFKADTGDSLVEKILGSPTKDGYQAGQTGQVRSDHAWSFSSGALEQLKEWEGRSKEAPNENNIENIRTKAREDFGAGRSGGGGISLHTPATMLTNLNMAKVKGAVYENERLILIYEEKKILFPPLDPEFIALAIRSVYGGEGIVKGELIADEKGAVIIQTGREQFGEVVWRKEFLGSSTGDVAIALPIGLAIGPAVGALHLPEPSKERITYYGPIKNTRMGKILMEADETLISFFTGIDWRTGLPFLPSNIDGFMSIIERDARGLRQLPDNKTNTQMDKKKWWDSIVWWVIVPDRLSLRLTKDGKAFEFIDVCMRFVVWSTKESNILKDDMEAASHFSVHYKELSREFPALRELEEVAKVLAVVRWLKQNNVPVDLSWANNYKLEEIFTPEKVLRFSVVPVKNEEGRAIIEK